MVHRLTIKGQVTIPKVIREFLGLREGNSCVEFAVAPDGSVVVRKAQPVAPKRETGPGPRSRLRRQLNTPRVNFAATLAA